MDQPSGDVDIGGGGDDMAGGGGDVDDSGSYCASSSSSASATSWSLDDGDIFIDSSKKVKAGQTADNNDDDYSISRGGVFDDWGNTGTRDLAWDDDDGDDSSSDNHDDDQAESDNILYRFGNTKKIAAGGRFSTTAASRSAILFLAQDSRF
jgi:hypothetical protein